ncbi:hypothetical protein BJY00DRAFT_319917 [Aspergillus carlsbadensis]|nr:hypothetical protein BJY00DRAFT_319917 [Aspergillus carlsbadensis]
MASIFCTQAPRAREALARETTYPLHVTDLRSSLLCHTNGTLDDTIVSILFRLRDARPSARYGSSETDESNSIGRALSRATWSCLKIVRMAYLSLDQQTLERLCASLPDDLEGFVMNTISLEDGVWSTTLDILRDKLSVRLMQQKCKIQFHNLEGGELSEDDVWAVCEPGEETEEFWRKTWMFSDEKEILDQLIEKYVSRAGISENPLRGDIKQILDEGPR